MRKKVKLNNAAPSGVHLYAATEKKADKKPVKKGRK